MADLTPTDEQEQALAAFRTGRSFVIEAVAGSGKTSSMEMLARDTERRGQYMAFNRAIVDDGAARFPANVSCNTVHSLGWRAVGHEYAHRLRGSKRMSPTQLARELGIDPFTIRVGSQARRLAPGFLAGLVMRSVNLFCQSADEQPTSRHVPYQDGIDFPNPDGSRNYDNNDALAIHLEPFIRQAWSDLTKLDGRLRFDHAHYLKMFELSHPRLHVDFVLFDEAQDSSKVMASIVEAQTHAQRIYCGDSHQSIYSWMGAVNALERLDGERVFLTRSFRFGDQIATLANRVLGRLGAGVRVVGTESIPSVIEPVPDPDVILCRTNAEAVRQVLVALAGGLRPHLVGGGKEIASFAKGAQTLQREGWSSHPDLACFGSWGEVQEYVRADALGDELALMVGLIEEYGVDTVLRAVENMPPEDRADLIVSTAHKAKGREWPSVKLAGDFMVDDKTEPEELRLMYVAVTRARYRLDVSAVPFLLAPPRPAETVIPGVG